MSLVEVPITHKRAATLSPSRSPRQIQPEDGDDPHMMDPAAVREALGGSR